MMDWEPKDNIEDAIRYLKKAVLYFTKAEEYDRAADIIHTIRALEAILND